MKMTLLAAAFVFTSLLAACGGAETEELTQPEPQSLETRDDKVTVDDALGDITRYGPRSLPSDTPAALVTITSPKGRVFNIHDIIAFNGRDPNNDYYPFARMKGAFRTTSTLAAPNPIGNETTYVAAPYTTSAPAAQVYECRANGTGGFVWTFLRPEAGMVPITSQPIDLGGLTFDHFRYPGGITYDSWSGDSVIDWLTGTPGAGPAWRLVYPQSAYSGSYPLHPTQGQAFTVGTADVTVANGTANVPLLRVRNTGGAMRNFYSNVLSFTDPTYTQAIGYVFRLHTSGGIAPTTGCASTTDVGKLFRSPYFTEYYFVDVYWAGF